MGENGQATVFADNDTLATKTFVRSLNVGIPTLAQVTVTDTITTKGIVINGKIGILNTGGSVFVGEGAGADDDGTNNYNTFLGYNAGSNNTSGYNNIALGKNALFTNTTGANNISIGSSSLYLNLTGGNNTVFGYAALQNNTSGSANIAIGYNTLQANTSGAYNTANGNFALMANISGHHNVAIGSEAGRDIADDSPGNAYGVNNTFIGVETKAETSTDTNSFVIGYRAISNGTNTGTLGNADVTDVYIGEDGQAATIQTILKLVPTTEPTSPSLGWIYVSSVDTHMYMYNGTTWKQLDN
jgi:hypothetical protein